MLGPFSKLVDKRVISTVVQDARWLVGTTLMDDSDVDFGKSMRIYFDDNTYIDIEPVQDPHDPDGLLVGSRAGTWQADENNVIEVLT